MNYKELLMLEDLERRIFKDDYAPLKCLCCHQTDSTVLSSVYIPASPAGPGGEFDLCLHCASNTLKDVEEQLDWYYNSVL